jgi:mRNA interferase RelE/StbE
MSWAIALSNRARRNLKRVPIADQQRIMAHLDAMRVNPLFGDVLKLTGQDAFRRRVGSYRIIFDVDFKSFSVKITTIERRTTTTYR